ncbi:2,3-diaminopropionate biosynthesis protein SbnA [Pendulispora brunnea]|uniref:2,3-diaminopropionate biosynthesis protein SbnA n=1 Tax=Pendulispora brunnea TaxID=2905690 RepID=A0ABZ2KJS8_9BACT
MIQANPSLRLLEKLAPLRAALRPVPFVKLECSGIQLYVKMDLFNPIGSIKDIPALFILQRAVERGEVTPFTTVTESSSGNFALALATYCRFLGLRFVPVIDPNITAGYEAAIRALCDEVIKVTERDDTGGFLKTRLAAVERFQRERGDTFWTNQYGNPDNIMGHYTLTAAGFCEQLPRLDYVFLGVSSGGTIAGVSQRLKEHFPDVRVVAVDVVGSVIFGGAPAARHIPGIGSSIRPPLVESARIDEVMHISEASTVTACRELLERHGLFVGGSTGSVYAAILRHLPRLRGAGTPPVVAFIACDRGAAYVDTIYNPMWCRRIEATEARDGEASAHPTRVA